MFPGPLILNPVKYLSKSGGTLSAPTEPKKFGVASEVEGVITSITLASGQVIAYRI